MLTDIPNLTLVVAHHDDEVIFAGGLLYARYLKSLPTKCLYCVRYDDENPITDDGEAEKRRIENRKRAQESVVELLGGRASFTTKTLNQNNFRDEVAETSSRYSEALDSLIFELSQEIGKDSVILTHGPLGETGHPMHKLVHKAVLGVEEADIFCFSDSLEADIQLEIEVEAKDKLVVCYRDATTRTPYWDPKENILLAPWCGSFERFEHYF